MASSRRYRLLCPIARALDRVGDRWTLLVLRDLHAGPARFSDLQRGLTGIATNLLTDRLQQLIEDGLVERREGDFGLALYALTPLGARTRPLLFELALFGGLFPPGEEPRRPGNLRTIAVTLSAACQRAVTPDLSFVAEIEVDGERFELRAHEGEVAMRVGAPAAPDVVMSTSYEPMIAAGEGEISLESFSEKHVTMTTRTPGKDRELFTLLAGAMAVLQQAGESERRTDPT